MTSVVTHFAVYGICYYEGKLLCVEKSRGPYTGYYDLPGGSQMECESLIDTLYREVAEETGFTVLDILDNRIYDVFVTERGHDDTVHHTFALYHIEVDLEKQEDISFLENGDVNDSSGIKWVPIEQLNASNASPLVLKAIEKEVSLEAYIYRNWIRKD